MHESSEGALDVVRSTSEPIHDIGTAIYLSPDVFAWAGEWGWSNPFSFYFAGRGGMLGDVSADVVCAALGWFEPGAVKAMYEEGAAVATPSVGAQRMAEATARWGQKYLSDIDGLEDIVALTEATVDGLEGSALPLFVGWRGADRAGDAGGRAAQLMQILREWRGGLHLVATTAAGLSPLEAILTNEGEGQAKFFGWPEPFSNCDAIRDRHREAEDLTDRLCAAALRRALRPEEDQAFVAGVAAVRDALPSAP
ncbi:MAG: SCO6745 family protein [Acidimicrobiales bacterium]